MYYRLRATFVAVPLSGEALLFRSDTRSLKVEGTFAVLLAKSLLGYLDGQLAVEDTARLCQVPVDAISENLDALVGAGVFESSDSPLTPKDTDPRLNLPRVLTSGSPDLESRLSTTRVAVFGLEGVGAAAAHQLAEAGFLRFLFVDPFDGRGRAVAEELQRRHRSIAVDVFGGDRLDRQAVKELAGAADVLLAFWDRGFEAGNHWVNRASVELTKPALFCSVAGTKAMAGPFVVPGMTPCYMCARMRAVAAEDVFEDAMACEVFFDQLKRPGLAHREFFATSLSVLAGLVATDVYKYVVLQYQPTLLGQVMEFDPMTLGLDRHTLLEHPQCPVCAKKKTTFVTIPAWTNSRTHDYPAAG
jgi:bacteriocin biosynthesis cyclodehydratase domain-containing protein